LNYAVSEDLREEKGDALIGKIQIDLEEIATAFSLQYMGVAI
jgi:hypothetical protein